VRAQYIHRQTSGKQKTLSFSAKRRTVAVIIPQPTTTLFIKPADKDYGHQQWPQLRFLPSSIFAG
jgi:hypothetical protein